MANNGKPASKKFGKRQIKFYEANEKKIKELATNLPEALFNFMDNYEFTEHQKSQYVANYAKKLAIVEDKGYEVADRNDLVKYNLKLLRRLQEEMSKIQELYSMVTDSIKYRERMALTLDVERSTLMDLLGHGGRHLPLWIGKVGEMPPARAGRLVDDSMPAVGELIGAFANEMWILAEVKAASPDRKLVIRDVDDDKRTHYQVIRDHILLLPLYRVDPKRSPFAIFEKHSVVLALYPQTTCFYKGIVESPPFVSDDPYLITFEDEDYEGGYAPAVHVPQRYVLNFRNHPSTSSATKVEASDSSATEEDTPEPEHAPMPIRRRFKVRDSDELTDEEERETESGNASHSDDQPSEDNVDQEPFSPIAGQAFPSSPRSSVDDDELESVSESPNPLRGLDEEYYSENSE